MGSAGRALASRTGPLGADGFVPRGVVPFPGGPGHGLDAGGVIEGGRGVRGTGLDAHREAGAQPAEFPGAPRGGHPGLLGELPPLRPLLQPLQRILGPLGK